MKNGYAWLYRLLCDRRGQDLIEYAMLAGFVAVAAAAVFPTQIAPNIQMVFSKVNSSLAATPSGN